MSKKIKKVIIAQVSKPLKFKVKSFEFNDPKENARIRVALQGLVVNPGWIVYKQIVEKSIEYLEKQILRKIGLGEDGKVKQLTNDEVDILRQKYEVYIEMLEKPDSLIIDLTPKNTKIVEERENNDPYN